MRYACNENPHIYYIDGMFVCIWVDEMKPIIFSWAHTIFLHIAFSLSLLFVNLFFNFYQFIVYSIAFHFPIFFLIFSYSVLSHLRVHNFWGLWWFLVNYFVCTRDLWQMRCVVLLTHFRQKQTELIYKVEHFTLFHTWVDVLAVDKFLFKEISFTLL